MTEMIKFSFLIPAYNVSNYILKAVNSIICDPRNDLEVIIVNDGSTDSTLDLLNSINDPRVKIISQKNKGISATRNVGITNSQGQYIIFMDGDDEYNIKYLNDMIKPFENNPDIVLTYGNYMPIDIMSNHLPISPYGRLFNRPSGNVLKLILQKNFIGVPGVCCIKSSAIAKNGPFNINISMSEDWEYWCRLASEGDFVFIPRNILRYRQLATSMSSVQGQKIENFWPAVNSIFNNEKIKKHFSEKHLNKLKNSHIAHIYIFMSSKYILMNNYHNSLQLLFKAIITYPLRSGEFIARYILNIIRNFIS